MTDTRLLDRWLLWPRRNPDAGTRLFALTYAGGGASTFRTWPRDLPAWVELAAVQLPGRENRLAEPAYTSLAALVPALGEAVLRQLDRPYAVFGHSLGALIGFELCRWLRRHDARAPLHLFVSAHGPPHLPNPNPDIHQLPDVEFRQAVQRYNGTPAAILDNPELMQLLLPRLRADFTALETYQHDPEDRLACGVTVVGGVDDREVHPEFLKAWREMTSGPFTLRLFPGDHFFLQTAQASLIRAIADDLIRVGAATVLPAPSSA